MTETPPTEDDPQVRKAGLLVLAAFTGLALLTVLGGGGWLGYSAYHSESAGVRSMYILAFPLGFSCTGFIAAVASHFLVKKSLPLKVAVPLVAGAVGGVGFFLAIFVFFTLIFPAL